MPSIATLSRYITKKEKQLKSQNNKLVYAKELPDKISAKSEIERLEKELLDLRQQLTFQRVLSDVQRDKETKTTKRVSASKQDGQGCDQVGFGESW